MTKKAKRATMANRQAPYPVKSRVSRDPPPIQQSAVRPVKVELVAVPANTTSITVGTVSTALDNFIGATSQFCLIKVSAWGPDIQSTTASSPRLLVTDSATKRDFTDNGTAGASRSAVGISYPAAAQIVQTYNKSSTTELLSVTGAALLHVTVQTWK